MCISVNSVLREITCGVVVIEGLDVGTINPSFIEGVLLSEEVYSCIDFKLNIDLNAHANLHNTLTKFLQDHIWPEPTIVHLSFLPFPT